MLFLIQSYPVDGAESDFSSSDIWLWTFGSSYQHLSSSWRACYILIFIGWGVGRFWRCTVVSSLDISIQSDYSLVFRWNYFSRYTRCRCQVMNMSANTHPSICFRTLLDSRRICWVLLRFCLCNNNDDAQAGSLWRVGGARNCTVGLWLLPLGFLFCEFFFFSLIPNKPRLILDISGM